MLILMLGFLLRNFMISVLLVYIIHIHVYLPNKEIIVYIFNIYLYPWHLLAVHFRSVYPIMKGLSLDW